MPACLPNWDTLSEWHVKRKARPRIKGQNGTDFPFEASTGNHIPE